MALIREILKAHFEKSTLPGWQAQRRMSVRQDEHLRLKVPPDARDAAVLALIHTKEEPGVYLIERQHHDKDRHSGQLSFPGGQVEPHDKDLLSTALRESQEEIGLDTGMIEVVGSLSPLYIPVSNFLVHPFVAHSHEELSLNREEKEVARILKLDLGTLLHQETRTRTVRLRNGMNLDNVPFYPLGDVFVWGATAMILAELGHILESNPKFAKTLDLNPI